ncbi:hypothetical protein [Kitasatospora sp. NPDC002040]|uniref:hypothetical protein n=1 Tax=Kitasatospora sp. NPDC002040 TaxID=3154661 RepID=UPI00331F2E52
MPASDSTPQLPDPASVILLEPGYTAVPWEGQIVAMTVGRDHDGTAFVPAIVDGQAVPLPVFDAPVWRDAADARLAEHRRAIAAMDPVSPVVPAVQAPPMAAATLAQSAADPGLPLAVRQYVLYGSVAALAAGEAVWMVGAAVAAVAPHADELGDLLKWAAVLVGAVVLGVAGLLGKFRSLGGSTGAAASATGDGATASGTVLALVHRTHQTQIDKQSAGWRGTVTNNNG